MQIPRFYDENKKEEKNINVAEIWLKRIFNEICSALAVVQNKKQKQA